MTQRSESCQLCKAHCYVDTEHKQCFLDCDGDEQCERVCQLRANRCIMEDCYKNGWCCEESCPIPPQQAPQRTSCLDCDTSCWGTYSDCREECIPGTDEYIPCIQDCEFTVSECGLDCYRNGKCCEEACEVTPDLLSASHRMRRPNIWQQQNRINPTYRNQINTRSSPQHRTYAAQTRMNPLLGR